MYYHLPINIRGIGDYQAAECALSTGCSDVTGAVQINIDTFASFSALYLCVSDILLTHTTHKSEIHTRARYRDILMFVHTRA